MIRVLLFTAAVAAVSAIAAGLVRLVFDRLARRERRPAEGAATPAAPPSVAQPATSAPVPRPVGSATSGTFALTTHWTDPALAGEPVAAGQTATAARVTELAA